MTKNAACCWLWEWSGRRRTYVRTSRRRPAGAPLSKHRPCSPLPLSTQLAASLIAGAMLLANRQVDNAFRACPAAAGDADEHPCSPLPPTLLRAVDPTAGACGVARALRLANLWRGTQRRVCMLCTWLPSLSAAACTTDRMHLPVATTGCNLDAFKLQGRSAGRMERCSSIMGCLREVGLRY